RLAVGFAAGAVIAKQSPHMECRARRRRTPSFHEQQRRLKSRNVGGGPSRNRTGVQGFAVLCVTTPPSGRGGGRALAPASAAGQPPADASGRFDEWRLALAAPTDKSQLDL